MKSFFQVRDLSEIRKMKSRFSICGTESVPLSASPGRILAADIAADIDLPDFRRSTMDGYAVAASATFGAAEGSPAYLPVAGRIEMGEIPSFSLPAGQAARIATGGMLPEGADAVVMVEYTGMLDDSLIEVYRSVAPGTHVIEAGEDFRKGDIPLKPGRRIGPAECGLLAAFGYAEAPVYARPRVGVISTGDEIIPVDAFPGPGQVRDINTHTLSALAAADGAEVRAYGIIRDDETALINICRRAVAENDTIFISGGSSVGARDFTVAAIQAQPAAEILAHGIAIRPGKPTILADIGGRPFWGLPGHAVSAMIVYKAVVRPFLLHLAGHAPAADRAGEIHPGMPWVPAHMSRNIASVQGRTDFVRVRLSEKDGGMTADPVLGKSGLIRTMVLASGLVVIEKDREGLNAGDPVRVFLL
ncbi:MAG: molybdopterin molybdenumtransferase MoeA [Desulfobacterales bacterium]|nr:MAG: molybdopterin molybdenumtransferase MoeA [Desulfobacterales bacterium]